MSYDPETAAELKRIPANAIDQDGKAVFGVPGPGSYKVASMVRLPGKGAGDDDAGKHVFRKAPAYSLQARTKVQVPTPESPGPTGYTPSVKLTTERQKKAVFGTSTRKKEAGRFMGPCFIQTSDDASPGPAMYRRREGKGLEKTMGDAPTWKFGSTEQRPALLTACSPAADYELPSGLTKQGCTIAPHGEYERGLQRDKVREGMNNVYLGPLHNKVEPYEMKISPGPAMYNAGEHDLDVLSTFRNDKGDGSFDRAGPVAWDKLYMGKELETFGQFGAAVLYASRSSFLQDGRHMSFGKTKRFNSRIAGMAETGCDSPGPIYLVRGENEQPHWSFPQSVRRMERTTDPTNPGPGAYIPKKTQDQFAFAQQPAYSVASNIRTDWAKLFGVTDFPGPGTYDANPGLTRKSAPAAGLHPLDQKGRTSFVAPNTVPGPGTHDPASAESFGSGPKYSLAGKEKETRARFISRLHVAESLGTESPGPGGINVRDANVHQSKSLSPVAKFDLCSRWHKKKLYNGRGFDAEDRGIGVPGPGMYDVKSAEMNKGCTFSKSKRAELATVMF